MYWAKRSVDCRDASNRQIDKLPEHHDHGHFLCRSPQLG